MSQYANSRMENTSVSFSLITDNRTLFAKKIVTFVTFVTLHSLI